MPPTNIDSTTKLQHVNSCCCDHATAMQPNASTRQASQGSIEQAVIKLQLVTCEAKVQGAISEQLQLLLAPDAAAGD